MQSVVNRASPRTSPARFLLREFSFPSSICCRCRFRTWSFYSTRTSSSSVEKGTQHQDGYEDGLETGSTGSANDSSFYSASQHDRINNHSLSQKDWDRLPSHREGRRSKLSKRFTHLMDDLQTNIFFAGQKLNDLTGYSGIEALKKEIDKQEDEVRHTRQTLRDAKSAYSTAIATRSASQREVNELLQRKHAWSHGDLERFTTLYRSDHANEQAEAAAQEALTKAEREAEEAASRLSKTILARYHEEQIWSDKIRRMSTWGTWGLMGVNVLLFLVFQFALEPWRRKRLVRGFEEKVKEALEKEGIEISPDTQSLSMADVPLITEATTTPEAMHEDAQSEDPISDPESLSQAEIPLDPTEDPETPPTLPYELSFLQKSRRFLHNTKEDIQSLVSDQPVTVRKVDFTIAVLQGAAVGATVMGGVVLAFARVR